MSNFKMYSIFSGNIRRIGWKLNEETQKGVLRVEFMNGQQYDYSPVPQEKYKEIFSVEGSRGKWFAEQIKSDVKIKYEKVKDEDLTP